MGPHRSFDVQKIYPAPRERKQESARRVNSQKNSKFFANQDTVASHRKGLKDGSRSEEKLSTLISRWVSTIRMTRPGVLERSILVCMKNLPATCQRYRISHSCLGSRDIAGEINATPLSEMMSLKKERNCAFY